MGVYACSRHPKPNVNDLRSRQRSAIVYPYRVRHTIISAFCATVKIIVQQFMYIEAFLKDQKKTFGYYTSPESHPSLTSNPFHLLSEH